MALDTESGTGPATRPEATSRARPVERRRLDVQGLRAVAVLVVVGYHAGLPLPGGFVGVDVFFVISGFVITGMLHREWSTHGRIRFARFYLRRFKRLTPALALMVAVTVLLSTLFLSPLGAQQSTAQTAVGAMFLLANAVIARTTGNYFDAPAETNALLHTWSLSVEEQFYLCFPLLLAGCWWVALRRGRGARRVAPLVVGAVTLLSLGIAIAVSRGLELQAGEMLVGFYGPLTRVWEFGAGALLALLPGWAAVRSRASGRVSGVIGAAMLVAALVLISGATPFPGPWTLLPVVATALLIRAGGRDDNPLARVLRTRPMVRVGDWSYSIYLWHWPFIVFAGALWPNEPLALVVAAVLSVGPAVASYVWVEEPIRAMELRGPRGIARLVVPSLAIPLFLAGLLGVAVQQGFWSSTIRGHQAAVLDAHEGCIDLPLRHETATRCTFNASGGGDPVYLLGDSHAQHFSEAVIAAGTGQRRPVVVATTSACPFIDLQVTEVQGTPGQAEQCSSFLESARTYMSAAEEGTAVLAATDIYWTDPRFVVTDSFGTLAVTSRAKVLEATAALESTVRQLQAAGHDVVLVQSVPRWTGSDEWNPADCSLLSVQFGWGSCEKRMRLAAFDERQGVVRAAVRQVAEMTGARIVEPRDRLCSEGWCSTHDQGLTVYRDATHISVSQSEAMASVFQEALGARGRT